MAPRPALDVSFARAWPAAGDSVHGVRRKAPQQSALAEEPDEGACRRRERARLEV